MAFDPSKSFGITDDGLTIDGGYTLLSGSSLPADVLPTPNVPCIYERTNGQRWKNDGVGGGWIMDTISAAGGFSVRRVPEGQTVTIPDGYENVTSGRRIVVEGKLVVEGMNTVLF